MTVPSFAFGSIEKGAARVALIYIAIGIVWITTSDRALVMLVDPLGSSYALLQSFKGTLFVLVTGFLLYVLVRQALQKEHGITSALYEAHGRFDATFEHAAVGLAHVDLDGRLLVFNQRLCEITGYSREELAGLTFHEITHPDDLQADLDLLQQLIAGEIDTYAMEKRYVRKDGDPIWIHLTVSLVVGDSRQPTYCIAVVKDISDRKNAVLALIESEERYHSLFENSPDAVIVHARGKILDANRAAGELAGLPDASDLIGTDLMSFVPPDSRAVVNEPIGMLYDGASIPPTEEKMIRPDGTVVESEVIGVPITYNGERAVQVVIHDITERKQQERKLVEAKEKAEEMSRLKTAFLTNMSHEIRTPLTGILGFAEILAGELADEHREFTDYITVSAERLMETLTSILDLAQLESGNARVNFEKIDVIAELEKTVKLFLPRAHEGGLALNLHVGGSPALRAVTDKAALNRILTNLLSNAIKFTPYGQIDVRVRPSGHRIEIQVEDSGVGIEPDFLPHIFDEFKQESNGTGRQFEGSGLGLTISKRLAKKMGAELNVESTKGRGSTFTLSLPGVDRAPAPVEPSRATPDDANDRSGKILVVDDNIVVHRLFRAHFGKVFEIDYALNASEARALGSSQHYDAVILDIDLGKGPSGVELFHEFRGMPAYVDVPIIAVTAYALPGDRDRFLEIGFDGYVSKPFRQNDVLELLDPVLSAKVNDAGCAGDGWQGSADSDLIEGETGYFGVQFRP